MGTYKQRLIKHISEFLYNDNIERHNKDLVKVKYYRIKEGLQKLNSDELQALQTLLFHTLPE